MLWNIPHTCTIITLRIIIQHFLNTNITFTVSNFNILVRICFIIMLNKVAKIIYYYKVTVRFKKIESMIFINLIFYFYLPRLQFSIFYSLSYLILIYSKSYPKSSRIRLIFRLLYFISTIWSKRYVRIYLISKITLSSQIVLFYFRRSVK